MGLPQNILICATYCGEVGGSHKVFFLTGDSLGFYYGQAVTWEKLLHPLCAVVSNPSSAGSGHKAASAASSGDPALVTHWSVEVLCQQC